LSAEPRGRCSDFDGGGSFHLDSKDQSAQCRHPGEFMQLPRETGIPVKISTTSLTSGLGSATSEEKLCWCASKRKCYVWYMHYV